MMIKAIVAAVLIPLGYLYTTQTDGLTASAKRGEAVYKTNCQSCHQANGEGIAGVFPPLAKSDFLLKDQKRAIGVVLHGLNGEIKVNGQVFNMVMPAQGALSDQEVADVLNYVQNNWGNKAKPVTPTQVSEARKK
ncbi:c-type cytochrome [Pontibacter sp. CAU 1760]